MGRKIGTATLWNIDAWMGEGGVWQWNDKTKVSADDQFEVREDTNLGDFRSMALKHMLLDDPNLKAVEVSDHIVELQNMKLDDKPVLAFIIEEADDA